MDLDEATLLVREVKDAYRRRNAAAGLATWSATDYTMGLVGDVGDLAKLVLAKDGKRDRGADVSAELEHELSDCLWAVLAIADEYQVDLKRVFPEQVQLLLRHLTSYGSA